MYFDVCDLQPESLGGDDGHNGSSSRSDVLGARRNCDRAVGIDRQVARSRMRSARPGVKGEPEALADRPWVAFSSRMPTLRPIHGLRRYRKLFLVDFGPLPYQGDVC